MLHHVTVVFHLVILLRKLMLLLLSLPPLLPLWVVLLLGLATVVLFVVYVGA